MVCKITLDNGLRIVYEKITYVRSVSVGIWVGTGSRNENKKNNGISHFIEHMLFKGTNTRTAKEIAACIDNIGGQLNAFTGKECTCYYAKTLDTHIETAVDILSDMFFNSLFAEKDIDVEKKVILEEIGMYEDTPEDLVHDILSETVWNGNALGYPILGTQKCLKSINKNVIQEYIEKFYSPYNTVIAVAGNFEEDLLVDIIKKYFCNWQSDNKKAFDYPKVAFKSGYKIKEKDTEQAHICLAFEGIEHGNNDLYSLLAINSVLGGGMSSRLFQKIREEMGLVYSIYSYPSSYKNAGMFTVYAGMNPKHLPIVIKLVVDEIKVLLRDGIEKEDIEKAKEQLKGNYILGLESTSSRMNSIGKSELMQSYILTPEEILKKIDTINQESVNNVINKIFKLDELSYSVVGNISPKLNFSELL